MDHPFERCGDPDTAAVYQVERYAVRTYMAFYGEDSQPNPVLLQDLTPVTLVRSEHPFWATFQDRVQPFWTFVSGGCRPNRQTETAVEAAGFRIEPSDREASGVLRRFSARPVSDEMRRNPG